MIRHETLRGHGCVGLCIPHPAVSENGKYIFAAGHSQRVNKTRQDISLNREGDLSKIVLSDEARRDIPRVVYGATGARRSTIRLAPSPSIKEGGIIGGRGYWC